MANVNHSSLTDPYLHEPKGVAAAASGEVYVANGAGSGAWRFLPHAFCYYTDVGTGTTISTPISYTKVNPTTTGDPTQKDFTHTSPARLTYTGSTTIDANLFASITIKSSEASLQGIFFRFYKNGSPHGVESVTAALSGNYTHVSIVDHLELATNDYVEVYTKTATGSVVVHSIAIDIKGCV